MQIVKINDVGPLPIDKIPELIQRCADGNGGTRLVRIAENFSPPHRNPRVRSLIGLADQSCYPNTQ